MRRQKEETGGPKDKVTDEDCQLTLVDKKAAVQGGTSALAANTHAHVCTRGYYTMLHSFIWIADMRCSDQDLGGYQAIR